MASSSSSPNIVAPYCSKAGACKFLVSASATILLVLHCTSVMILSLTSWSTKVKVFLSKTNGIAYVIVWRLLVLRHGPSPRLPRGFHCCSSVSSFHSVCLLSHCFPQLFLRAELITLFLILSRTSIVFSFNRLKSHVPASFPLKACPRPPPLWMWPIVSFGISPCQLFPRSSCAL